MLILPLAGRGCNAAHAGARRLVLAFGAKYRTVAVTDRAIVMCRSSMWRPYKAKEFGARLPRSIQLGSAKGFLVPFVRILWASGTELLLCGTLLPSDPTRSTSTVASRTTCARPTPPSV